LHFQVIPSRESTLQDKNMSPSDRLVLTWLSQDN